MKRKILLLILSVILFSCVENDSPDKKEIKLSDGKIITVNIEEKEVSKTEKILLANFQIDERILKEETVEKHILEIWNILEKDADRRNLMEGIIQAKYFVGNEEDSDKKVYEEFLFETEKIENGTWKIRKVN
jgi:hypothetical protein